MTETKHAAQSIKVSHETLNQLFREARTHNAWLPKRVPVEALREAYELARWGPTSANSSPARFVFLESEAAKARLLPALAPLNVEKTKAAPVTAIIAWDTEFHEKLPKLFPHADMRSFFVGKPALIEETAFRNSSLQGAYFMLAARAVGLDCGPMSGFDAAKVNAEFFPDGKWKVNFLCNLGYGDHTKLFPRSPRLDFDEACRVL
jgi:3-hydroxypropanoate dehydrogenase